MVRGGSIFHSSMSRQLLRLKDGQLSCVEEEAAHMVRERTAQMVREGAALMVRRGSSSYG